MRVRAFGDVRVELAISIVAAQCYPRDRELNNAEFALKSVISQVAPGISCAPRTDLVRWQVSR
jgi:hypothetical protein